MIIFKEDSSASNNTQILWNVNLVIYKITLIVLLLFLVIKCSNSGTEPENNTPAAKTNDFLVDTLATPETVALFNNLMSFANNKVLFGHQESTAYGIGWEYQGFEVDSDVKRVTGDFPAVHGWDLGDIHLSENLDGVSFFDMTRLIKKAYERGGINTISVHLDNPVSGGDAWDNSPAVPQILEGGSFHDSYLKTLDLIADYLLELKTDDGTYIPVIFRPYHEHNHSWPWWGSGSCTPDEYNRLWRMTVEYLRDDHEIHHLLYAISPQDISSEADYLWRYPGDEYVDILGLDYYKLYNSSNISDLQNSLEIVSNLAEAKNKISALTEVGLENIPISNWWTGYLLNALSKNDRTLSTAWALVWRNASTSHHFAPYPGHLSEYDFIQFYNSDKTVFESDLINMYQ
jgi:mannan endo-1,4-beta-mannosidase